MRSFILLLAFVGPLFAQFTTRTGCPPEGFTAIFAHTNLAHLPANGQYVICQTPEQDAADGQNVVYDFNITSLWKMTNSKLLVDNNIRVNVNFPARVDWDNVAVSLIPGAEPISAGDADYRGFVFQGAYVDHHTPNEYGNCGSLVNVRVDGVDDDNDVYQFYNCSSKTTLKNVKAYNGQRSFLFEDVYGLIAYDLLGAGDQLGDEDYEALQIVRSRMGLIRPSVFNGDAGNDGIEVLDGSYVTICDPFIFARGDHLKLGEGATEDPVAVALAGVANFDVPGDASFTGTGGILFTLKKCPSKIKSSYDMHEWSNFYTE